MKKAEYKGEIYNIETIYVYDEYIRLYKGNLLETESIKVALSEVRILPLTDSNPTLTDTDFRNYAWDLEGIDTGTPSGMGRYLERLEELVCDEEKLQEVKNRIKE